MLSITAGAERWWGMRNASAAAAPMLTRTVTSTGDAQVGTPGCGDGCSLREAITTSTAGDTIDFDPAVFSTPQTITLTAGELAINKALTVKGPGANLLTVSGNRASRVFNLGTANFNVTISGLTIANGQAPSVVRTIAGYAEGGAIYKNGTGTLTIRECTLTNNAATNSAGSIKYSKGGAIFNSTGVLNVIDSTIADNLAGTPDNQSDVSMGGGIHIEDGGQVHLTNCTLRGNKSSIRSVVVGYMQGGAISSVNGDLTITGCTLENNAAEGDGFTTEQRCQGGALYLESTSLTILNSSLSSNRASATNYSNNYCYGGAIYSTRSFLHVVSSTLTGNAAVSVDGFRNFGYGGVIYNEISNVTLTNSTLSGNSASAIGVNEINESRGGAIYNGTAASNVKTVLNVISSTLTGNSSFVKELARVNLSSGGGIYNFNTDPVIVKNSIIARNTNTSAADFSGTVFTPTPDVLGGFTSQGFNLIGDNSGSTGFTNGANNDHVGSAATPLDPLLNILANNGGPTMTHALRPGSPAIDRGGNSGVTTDQRGLPRPVDDPATQNAQDGSDIGAFEVQTFITCQPITAALSGGGMIQPGGSAPLTVSLTGGSAPYTISLSNNGGTLTGSSPLQFTVSPTVTTTYTISAANDANGCPATASGSATVAVADTTPPLITCPANIIGVLDLQQCNATINPGMATATDNITTNPTITGTRSDGLPLNTPYPIGITTILWQATDAAKNSADCTQTVTVNCPTITFSTLATSGVAGSFYDQTLSAMPAGNYSYQVSETLPPGLTLDPTTGRLSGTPTQAGQFDFLVTATNCGCSGSRSYTLTIACPAITLSPASLSNGTAGSNYNATISASPSGTYSFSLLSGSLPPGLTLNAVTGVLSGITTTMGTFNFVIRALSSGGCSAKQSYSLAFTCPSITLSVLPTPALNTAYQQTISATPATMYSFSITSGALPAGLTLNAVTGVISGTPTKAGPYSFTVSARGFGACTGNRTYTGTIRGGSCPTIRLPSLPNGKPGQLYIQSVAATPSGNYNYEVITGTLPPGLTLYGAVGLIYGYPTQTGSFSFAITATDNNACIEQRTYNLTISAGATAGN
jgi:CSLREA domain-containing protein